MEEKVVETLKILDDEGDSFAKRAEMYYRKRPEIISFVEESFRAYKSLAEKYDHLSREFQSANRTIASCFPERAQYPLDEDEEKGRGITSSVNDNESPATPTSSIPKVPKFPKKEFKSQSMLISRKRPQRRSSSSTKPVTSTPIPGLSKDAAISEIDKLQKEILTLQTEKEFVRSLYERSYEKHWEIEDQIEAMQKRVCCLQDVYGVGTVIEDNDARTLMAATALRSCQETLAKLQEIQAKSSEEAKVEYERVRQAHEKFEALRDEFIYRHISHMDPEPHDGDKSETEGEEQMKKEEKASLEQEAQDVNQLREKIKEQLAGDSISSQTGLVERLRSDTDDLQTNIKSLEDDNEILKGGSDQMNKKLKELEEELRKVKNLNQNVKNRDNSLQTHFTEASCNLEHLSERLLDVKLDEKMKSADVKLTNEENQEEAANPSEDVKNEDNESRLSENLNFISERIKKLGRLENDDLSETVSNQDIESQDFHGGDEDRPNWRQMFISGLDDREKILLEEYTSTLRNYKDVSMKLNDVEKKNRDGIFELAFQRFRHIVSKRYPLSNLEKKFRFDIDDLLEENLEFWLRNSNSKQPSSQSEIRPIFRHMREIRAELSLWLENNSILQEELHGRYSSLCNIQDEISRVAIADSELSGYQAAKFQVDKTLEDLDQTFGVGTQSRIKHSSSSRNRIPLRSFLFGAKLKKPRQSLFACVNPHFSNLEATKENAPI
ncbi:hypothetical protein K1719_021604 [Acacia pycnantha]|nr:hypothetical protein K1719_021604 [Acacia pycnantha]